MNEMKTNKQTPVLEYQEIKKSSLRRRATTREISEG